MDPPALEMGAAIESQRRSPAAARLHSAAVSSGKGTRQEPGFYQRLKAVANAEYSFAVLDEALERIPEMIPQVKCEHDARSEIVAV